MWPVRAEKDGDWNDAFYPIGNGLKEAIEKVRVRGDRRADEELESGNRDRRSSFLAANQAASAAVKGKETGANA